MTGTMISLLSALSLGVALVAHPAPLVLKNSQANIVLAPEKGGCVISCKDATTNAEYASHHGICVDIIPEQAYPGLLRTQSYHLKAHTRNEAVLTATATGSRDKLHAKITKHYRLDRNRLHVSLKVQNLNPEKQTVTVRIQHVFRNDGQFLSFPITDGVHVIDGTSDNTPQRHGEIAGNWMAMIHPKTKQGVIMRFPRGMVRRVYNWYEAKQFGQEAYCRPLQLEKNACQEISYSLELVRNTLPTVAVIGNLAIGLDTPRLETGFNYQMSVTPLAEHAVPSVTAEGYVKNHVRTVNISQAGEMRLPWINSIIDRMVFRTPEGKALIRRTIYNETLKKPKRPDFSKVKIPQVFPYGDYNWGGAELGSYVLGPEINSYRRLAVNFRRAYMNTVISGAYFWPPKHYDEFKRTGKLQEAEVLKEYNFHVIAKGELYHWRPKQTVFRTPEDVRKDIRRRGYDLETIQKITRKYADQIILYDVSDEPLPQWLSDVVVGNQFWYDNVAGSTPVSPIFNLSAGIYVPYHAVMFGDAYGAHHSNTGNSNFGYVDGLIRKTIALGGHQKPIWIMLQAFGSMEGEKKTVDWRLPDAAETRLMIWASVAGGAKGILYHANPGNPIWRHAGGYSDPALTSYGYQSPAWMAMAEAGKKLVPMGKLLIHADSFKSLPLESSFIGDARSNYRGPAIQLGLRKMDDGSGYLLCAYNNHIKGAERSVLKLNTRNDTTKVLVDLCSHALMLEPGAVSKPFQLMPGDGRVWFFGTRKGAERAVNVVKCGRAESEREILKIEARALEVNGIDAGALRLELTRIADACNAENGDEAMKHLNRARHEWNQALEAATAYKELREHTATARDELQKAYLILRNHPRKFVDLSVKVPPRTCRKGTSPAMTSLIRRMDELSQRLLKLEDKLLFDGNAEAQAKEGKSLRNDAHAIAQTIANLERTVR